MCLRVCAGELGVGSGRLYFSLKDQFMLQEITAEPPGRVVGLPLSLWR